MTDKVKCYSFLTKNRLEKRSRCLLLALLFFAEISGALKKAIDYLSSSLKINSITSFYTKMIENVCSNKSDRIGNPFHFHGQQQSAGISQKNETASDKSFFFDKIRRPKSI